MREGKLVVRGDEDDDGQALRADGFQDGETVEFGHLHVEKKEVWRMLANGVNRRAAVGALADDFNLRLGLEQLAQALARQRFVIHDQRSDFHDCFPCERES